MTQAYRDEREGLRAKAETLATELSERDTELEALRRQLSERNAVFERLQTVLEDRAEPRANAVKGSNAANAKRWRALVAGGVVSAGLAGGWFLFGAKARAGDASRPLPSTTERAPASSAPATGDLCSSLGVRLTVAGEDVEAPERGSTAFTAGHKYRRDGSRSPGFSVWGGALEVHGNGDFLPGDTGKTTLVDLTIQARGAGGGYTLARDGRSFLEVVSSDGKRISGRFEADVSKVSDTTREPPFGSPVTRVRGTFCLPARPADPSDTGP